jgi:hypothetical protein
VDSFERFARETSALTDQKFIVYPADFVGGTNYTILDADKRQVAS